MKIYNVVITETLQKTVEVAAENIDNALKIAKENYDNGETDYILTADDFSEVYFNVEGMKKCNS